SSSSLNDDVQQSLEEVILPQTNTQLISINIIPNGDEASTSHNVFNERLEDAYFDASTSFQYPSNVHTYYQPFPHKKKWTKDHPLHKIIGDLKLSGFTAVLALLKPERLKADRARKSHKSPTKSLFDVGSSRISIFTGSITEFVYLVEAHHHLNPIFIPKDNGPRRLDDGVFMLVLIARGRPLRFDEVHLSLVSLNPKLEVFYVLLYNQLFGPLVDDRSENLLVFRWQVVQVTLKV
nr:hypothetical protein [Tanacetum cinerariifolium]